MMSSHEPSHLCSNIDDISYTRYHNRGQHASGQGTINNINRQTTKYQCSPLNPLEPLRKRCSPSAAFDSAARFDPPRCAESTRLCIIQIIENWINSDGDAVPSSLFWLHGGAGAGKSAIAQSLSESFQEKKQLAASFFFFRSDASRNNADHLIPTLVSQLVRTFRRISPFVEDRIHENWDLFTKRYQIQIQELLVEPLLSLKSKGALLTHPRLIVIDGLDECENRDLQCELLRVIASAIPQIPYPLRFLVTSRPEAHITRLFNHDHDLQAITVHQYNLSEDPDADMDIRKFLENEFEEVRRVHRLGPHLPNAWPNQGALTSLVERSSGHFIYASTVIRFIRSPNHRPDDRLEIVLRLRPPQEGDRPYAQLDALYALIFAGVENHGQLEKICLVLGILYFQSRKVGIFSSKTSPSIEDILQLKAGDLLLLFDPILSLVAINGDNVRILHKSVFDYLLDCTRGGHLPFDLSRLHESAATYILKQGILRKTCDRDSFLHFAYHCRHAHLNDTLKIYLRSLEVPYPKSVMAKPKMFPPWDGNLNESLRSLVWHFFRTLSREEFDSTGQAQVYNRYAAKWMGYLRSAILRNKLRRIWNALKRFFTCQSSNPPNPVPAAKVHDLKRELDTLLTAWKPPGFNPLPEDEGTDLVRHLANIKQEHSFFSAYVTASSGNSDPIASSLVVGDDFIHSYNVGICGENSFLMLRTFSRHGNTCDQTILNTKFRSEFEVDILQHTMSYLVSVGRHLFSDIYQKYGILPDTLST